jgi:hypothetical protein
MAPRRILLIVLMGLAMAILTLNSQGCAPAPTPFQETFIVILANGVANDGDFKTVPNGKLAVIEHVSVYAVGIGAGNADYFITSTIGTSADFREVPIVTAPALSGVPVLGSQAYTAFANPGTKYGAVVRRLNLSGNVIARFVITGYFK